MKPTNAPKPTVDTTAPVTYVCAVCLSEQPIAQNAEIACTHCATEHGSSKVFFKQRAIPTTYSTM